MPRFPSDTKITMEAPSRYALNHCILGDEKHLVRTVNPVSGNSKGGATEKAPNVLADQQGLSPSRTRVADSRCRE